MIAQIHIGSRTVWAFRCLFCARRTRAGYGPSPIDPRAISLLDERRYAGQHIHDSANSLLADE